MCLWKKLDILALFSLRSISHKIRINFTNFPFNIGFEFIRLEVIGFKLISLEVIGLETIGFEMISLDRV